ncbi:MAG TPA: MBL fold metallo-hydrolase [Acidimicrobiia bacterium]|nr:MBL fold metallo-hydrolase [Acidimicrobiia bacterium]
MPDIVPVLDEGLGNSSYLVDLDDGRALVVDPTRDPGPYLALAERRGLSIAWSVESHLHADFVSGSRELAAHGATVVAPGAGGLEFAHRGLGDGDEVDLSGLTLRAMGTPGHTPEHLAYLLLDGERPLALFSGGSLLVGAVARTDLIAPERTEELARAQYRSITQRLLTLPDDLPVYPTHGAGSFCSAPAGGERTTTIGREKATNPLLAAPDEDAFVKTLLAGLGTYPSYFLRLRDVNRHGPRVYGGLPTLAPLSPAEVRHLVAAGAELVDVRPVEEFAAGHVPGALSNTLRPAFASWLGWLVPEGRALVFVVGEGQDRAELVRQALKVGYEDLRGELTGGMGAWREAGFEVTRIPLVEAGRLEGTVLDVRQDAEYVAGHVPGAHHVELGSLPEDDGLPSGAITVACGHGERAMTGASLLARRGHGDLAVLDGGPEDWSRASGQPLEAGP